VEKIIMIDKIAIPIANLIVHIWRDKIRKTFKREPVESVEVSEKELWELLKKYQKEAKLEGEDFVKLGAFVKYVFIKLNLRR